MIVTTERLISNDEIRRTPNATVIPAFCVDAVCLVPYGSYPGNMPGVYFSDEKHLREWLRAERDEGELRRFLARLVPEDDPLYRHTRRWRARRRSAHAAR